MSEGQIVLQLGDLIYADLVAPLASIIPPCHVAAFISPEMVVDFNVPDECAMTKTPSLEWIDHILDPRFACEAKKCSEFTVRHVDTYFSSHSVRFIRRFDQSLLKSQLEMEASVDDLTKFVPGYNLMSNNCETVCFGIVLKDPRSGTGQASIYGRLYETFRDPCLADSDTTFRSFANLVNEMINNVKLDSETKLCYVGSRLAKDKFQSMTGCLNEYLEKHGYIIPLEMACAVCRRHVMGQISGRGSVFDVGMRRWI